MAFWLAATAYAWTSWVLSGVYEMLLAAAFFASVADPRPSFAIRGFSRFVAAVGQRKHGEALASLVDP